MGLPRPAEGKQVKRAVLAIVVALPLFADDVLLKGGGRLTGVIADQTAETVTIDIGAGTMTVPMSTVVGIEKGTSSLQEYRARAATVAADDIEGWRTLGRWANERGLSVQAQEAFTHVHKAYPGDSEANDALGLVFYEGQWIPEEESYRARGYVKLGVDWMTPAERDAILADHEARESQNREAVMAEVQASEADRRAREEEEERLEEEERQRNRLPMLGDPLYWGWGTASVW
jgi:hypothetical protein